MPTVAAVADLQASLTDVSTLAQRDLSQVWSQIAHWDTDPMRSALLDVTPHVVDEYGQAAGRITADFYDELSPRSVFVAAPAETPPPTRVEAAVRWAMRAQFTASVSTPLDLLAGSVQRMIFNTSRATVLDNVARERGASWARYSSATACPFCRMLATRGAAYTSKAAAVQTASGDRYHGNCRCMAVPVRAGDTYEPPDYVAKWEAEYRDASKSLRDNGEQVTVNNLARLMR